MRFFKNKFTKEIESDIDNVLGVIRIIILAIDGEKNSNVAIKEEIIDKYGFENWKFYFSIPLIFGGIGMVIEKYPDQKRKFINERVSDYLNTRNKDYVKFLNDYANFVQQSSQESFFSETALWILWNVSKEKPTDKDLEISNSIANLILIGIKELEKIFQKKE